MPAPFDGQCSSDPLAGKQVDAKDFRMHSRRTPREIDNLAAQQTEAFLRRASITYLECCISLMMTHLQREEVATVLEKEAEMLRELD